MISIFSSVKQFTNRILNGISYTTLIIIAVVLGLAPFSPEPHLVEKLRLLANAELSRPIDIFDLFLHGTPVILLILKFTIEKLGSQTRTDNE